LLVILFNQLGKRGFAPSDALGGFEFAAFPPLQNGELEPGNADRLGF
jgi:hypothetical protein